MDKKKMTREELEARKERRRQLLRLIERARIELATGKRPPA